MLDLSVIPGFKFVCFYELLQSDIEVGDYSMREKGMEIFLFPQHHQEFILRVILQLLFSWKIPNPAWLPCVPWFIQARPN